jgi:hypothetical protein
LFCNGFAVTASHAAITKRMEAMSSCVGEIQAALVALMGEQEATKTIRVALQDKVT